MKNKAIDVAMNITLLVIYYTVTTFDKEFGAHE